MRTALLTVMASVLASGTALAGLPPPPVPVFGPIGGVIAPVVLAAAGAYVLYRRSNRD